MAIAKSAEAKYRADFARVEKATCPVWREGGCPQKAPVPLPSCVPSNPECVNGQCDLAN